MCGATGTILTGFFALEDGVFYGGGFHFLGIQCLGVISVIAWVVLTMSIVFLVIKETIGLRVPAEEEIAGLDKVEHGLASSYADFMPALDTTIPNTVKTSKVVPMEEAVPVEKVVAATKKTENKVTKDGEPPIKKVVIIAKESKFEALKQAMNNIGVTGMTVVHVLGCGVQKGSAEYYRGVEVEMSLLPKIKVEIVVSKVPVDTVVETAKKVLYTGHIGDGKIFVYNIENVIKVRTGEEGFAALQDVE